MAQIEGLTKFNPTKRFWSIDRSYTIGMSRLGAVIWTGDISVAWDALAQQPGTMLNWVRGMCLRFCRCEERDPPSPYEDTHTL